MSIPWLAALWLGALGLCAGLVWLWVDPWRSRVDVVSRRRLSVIGATVALAGVTTPSMIDHGWGVLWAEPDLFVIRACLLASVGLFSWARFGDPSNGRRRCPRCWYDMAAQAGRTCPECGRTARSEGHLRLSRPSRKLAARALLPLGAAAGVMLAVSSAIRSGRAGFPVCS